jgi:hypothetical protein
MGYLLGVCPLASARADGRLLKGCWGVFGGKIAVRKLEKCI